MENLESFDIPSFKKGSGIHIKKKNRGKFTEYCDGKVTQKCIDKAKKSGNKTLVKRATFAENARKWKHQKGGQILKFQNSGIIEIKDNVPIIIDEQSYEEPAVNYTKQESPDWPLLYALNKNPRINHFKQLDNRSYIDESSPHTWLNSKHRWEIFRQNYADWKGIPVEQVSLAESNKELGNLIYNSLLTPSYILDERSDYAEYFKQNPDAQGVYNPNDKEIIYRHATSPAKYGIHERMHAALAKALEYAISKIIPKVDKYLDSGKEIYARLMELRKAYGIHPSKVWNLDEIKNLQKNATDAREGSSGHYDILNRYSPEQILLLFNNIAQNKSSNVSNDINPNEGLSYAKKGNKLIHKPNGHRSILDNDWIPTKELKKKHKLVSYNKGGGTAKNDIDEKIKKVQIMHFLQQHQNNDTSDLIKYDAYRSNNIENYILNNDYPDIALDTYLFSPEDRHNAFINQGWIKLENPDYGLVSKGVGNRNLPMYQKNKDEADRKDLFVLGNEASNFQINDKDLYHAGYAPSVYYGNNNGELYYKKYDLHDYGQDEQKNRGARYGFLRNKFVNYLDKIGNPTVLSTGIIKINPDELDYSALSDKTAASIFNYLYNKDYANVKKAYNQFLYNTGYSSEEYSFVDYINNIMNLNDEQETN